MSFPEDNKPKMVKNINAILSDNSATSIALNTNQTVTKETDAIINGRTFEFIHTAVPLDDLQGNPIAAFEIFMDQTEIKAALRDSQNKENEVQNALRAAKEKELQLELIMKELAEKEAEIKNIMNAVNESNMVIYFDLDGTIIDINENFLEFFKMSKEDFIGKNHSDFNTIANSPEEYKKLWQKIAEGKTTEITSEIVLPSGSVWLHASYNGIKDVNGKVVKIINIATDVSSIKENEKVVQAMIDKLEKVKEYEKHETERVVNSLKMLAEGNFDFELVAESADEDTEKSYNTYSQIYFAVNNTIKSIKAMLNDTLKIADAAIEGKLDIRADSSVHKGEYFKIIDGLNRTLDAIISPLNVAAEYVNRIAKGDIPPKIVDEYKGDFNEIKNNLNQCIDAIKLLISDTNYLVESTIDGKLEIRADADKHHGDFQKIIQGINDTLNAVVQPLKVAANYIERISTGDIPNQISEKYRGDFNSIINNINTLIESTNNVTDAAYQISLGNLDVDLKARSENDRLIKAFIEMTSNLKYVIEQINFIAFNAIEGRLDTRIDQNNHSGDYRKIISGINNTLDAIIKPLNVSAEYMDRIAKGDIPPQITEIYKGDFSEIKNNLNQCIRAITLLVEDADFLSNAAIEGKLSIRADESKHNGDFKKIISGFNQTLDAAIAPTKEAVNVLKAMAQGDLTMLMEGDFKGDHAVLKQSINSSLFSINELLNQVTETVQKVLVGSSQVEQASQTLNDSSSEQAASIEQMSSSMIEIASQTKQNADNANNASKLAENSLIASEKGYEEMQQLTNAMNDINQSSKNIAKIIKVIDEIAFQTNLLALNAAVEAARAGVHGQGFAVVADEVRNLAARSAEAAKETAELIEGSIMKVDIGSNLSQKTANVLNEIKDQARKVAGLIREIAIASNEQAEGISEVEFGFTQIDKITQKNNVGAEQSALTAEELANQARLLSDMLDNFELLDMSYYRRKNRALAKNNRRNNHHIKPKFLNRRKSDEEFDTEEADDITLDDEDFEVNK